ncbi:Serine/threonine-protein kinase pakC [Diplonema papillatum]|nr:Serine/threonine-protein kinase pakC [Diplonema papillatum]
MNHRAAIRRVEQPANEAKVARLEQPVDAADAQEWKRLLADAPPVSAMQVDRSFFAAKLGPNPVSPWCRRYFILSGNFLLWFNSNAPDARSLGCYYLPGALTVCEGRGKKPYCLRILPTTPRRPGDKWKELLMSAETSQELDEWHSWFTGFTPGVTIGEPEPLENVVFVSHDESGTSALGLVGLPPMWESMLRQEGFTAADFKLHRHTLQLVVDFAQQNAEGVQAPSAHINPKSQPDEDRVEKVDPREALQKLVDEGDPQTLFGSLKKVDAGSQGEVYKAIRLEDNCVVALKKIFVKKPEKELGALEKEIRIMKEASHPNIINFFSCYMPAADVLWICMEFMSGGKLTDLISIDSLFIDEDVAFVAKTLCDPLAYLHERGLIHRDIKSDNVLLDETGKLTLADFGFGAELADGRKQKRETVVGTPYWMAPEVIKGEPYDDKADVWSLGILLLELVDGEPPNIHLSQMKALYTIISSPPPEPKQQRSELLHDFISARILQADPVARSSMRDLLSHPFLTTAAPQEDFIARRHRKMRNKKQQQSAQQKQTAVE